MTANKPSRFVRVYGKRPANKSTRIYRMRERIIRSLDKAIAEIRKELSEHN